MRVKPRRLHVPIGKKQYVVIGWSRDWNTLIPWVHYDKPANYFDHRTNISDSGTVKFNYWYIGPLAVIFAKWIEQ